MLNNCCIICTNAYDVTQEMKESKMIFYNQFNAQVLLVICKGFNNNINYYQVMWFLL